MKTKKYVLAALFIILVIVICVLAVYKFVPDKPFADADDIKISNVAVYEKNMQNNENWNQADSTEGFDLEAFEQILPLMRCSRMADVKGPFNTEDIYCEIDGKYKEKPFHIVLGVEDICCIYESAEKMYSIEDSHTWIRFVQYVNTYELVN